MKLWGWFLDLFTISYRERLRSEAYDLIARHKIESLRIRQEAMPRIKKYLEEKEKIKKDRIESEEKRIKTSMLDSVLRISACGRSYCGINQTG